MIEKKVLQERTIEEETSLEKQVMFNEDFYEARDALFAKISDEWFPCLIGGKFRIVSKITMEMMTESDAKAKFIDYRLTRIYAKNDCDVEIEINTYQEWRKSVSVLYGLAFDPAQPYGEAKDEYGQPVWNCWKGYAIQGVNNGKARRYLSHIFVNICSRNRDHFNFLMDWFAHMIQHPEDHIPVVIAIKGEQGTGKTKTFELFGKLLNKYFVTVNNSNLESNFNALFRNKILVFADESVWSGEIKTQNKLKNLTGNETISIELKGKDAYTNPNFMRLAIVTNGHWVAPVEHGNRRYFVLESGTRHINHPSYWSNMINDMNEGGFEDLMYYLQNRKIKTNFHAKDCIPTNDPVMIEQREETMVSENPVALWLMEDDSWKTLLGKTKTMTLYELFKVWALRAGIKKHLSIVSFGRYFKSFGTKWYAASGHKGFWDVDIQDIELKLDIYLKE